MEQNNKVEVINPFGPSIARVKMPNDLIESLNNYVDEIISNEEKIEKLNHGNNLAGSVTQEFKLEENFMRTSGWANFLANASSKWLEKTEGKKITKWHFSNRRH